MDVKISRSYARTLEVKKPDGTSVWFKHEASAEVVVSSDIAEQTYKDLEATVMQQVGDAVKTERARIEASFNPAPTADVPFESGKSTSSLLSNLPKL